MSAYANHRLIFSLGLLVTGLCYIRSADAGELSGLFRSLSFKKKEPKQNPLYNELELEPLTPSKANKVSKVLHFLHNKSQDAVYLPDDDDYDDDDGHEQSNKSAGQGEGRRHFKLERTKSKKWEGKSDDEVVAHICDEKPTRTCLAGLKLALKAGPEDKARLAQAFRRKPDHVNSTHLLFHVLFETGIKKIESKNYDEKLDKIIDVAVAKNPYAFAATKAISFAL